MMAMLMMMMMTTTTKALTKMAMAMQAYAKLHGCYEAVRKGTTSYAFKDLTEGAPQVVLAS